MKQILLSVTTMFSVAAACYGQYTAQKFEINTTGPSSGSVPAVLTEFMGKVYFTATDGLKGRELWWADGQAVGMVADVNPGSNSGVIDEPMCVAGNSLYFIGMDSALGRQVFEYDGVNKPRRITEFPNDPQRQLTSLRSMNGNVYFLKSAPGVMDGIWEYRPLGKILRRLPLEILPATWSTGRFAVMGSKIFYRADITGMGTELAAYDVATGQTATMDINAGTASSFPQNLYVYKNTLFFIATEPATGAELYMYNGFTEPERLTDLNVGTGGSFSYSGGNYGFRGEGNSLMFSANVKGGIEHNLFKLDVVSQTADMLDVPVYNYPIQHFANQSGDMYFSFSAGMFVYDGVNKPENINTKLAGQQINNASNLLASNGRIFFRSADVSGNNELWVLTDPNAVNVQEAAASINAVVYPNPASEVAYVQFDVQEPVHLNITLSDMQGRVVYESDVKQYSTGRQRVEIPMQQLATGNYVYAVMGTEGMVLQSGQLVKE